MEVPEGTTISGLVATLGRDYPAIAAAARHLVAAVNAEYVEPDTVLHPGDEVALIPPVSGGMRDQRARVEVTDKPLDPLLLIERTKRSRDGAVVTFVGIVRDNAEGHRVIFLDYEAYKEMAEAKLQEIVDEIRLRWELEDVAIYHRLGRLKVGEASLVVVVCSPHRPPAFEACAYAVDRVKEIVPVWKKEIWEDGERWVGHED